MNISKKCGTHMDIFETVLMSKIAHLLLSSVSGKKSSVSGKKSWEFLHAMPF